jgi:hypothetical protein
MFRIRSEHLDAMKESYERGFEAEALAHLRTMLADRTESLSDENLLRRVRSGANRAAFYGLETEQEIMSFIDASFFLGEEFDVDPGLAWARQLLDDRQLDPAARAETLLEWAIDSFEDAEGD